MYAILINDIVSLSSDNLCYTMKTTTNPRRLVTVPFSKTQCGVDFYINTGRSEEIRGVLTEHPLFRTDFFEFFFLRRARGTLLLGSRRIELHDGMVLLLSPHEQQQWLVDEEELDYTFLIFREDFMRTFLSDKLFVYRLLYCYQSDTPPWFDAPRERFGEYLRLLSKIKTELQAPTSDSYNLIVAVLYYLLVTLNRDYATAYGLPVALPRNNCAFRFKALLEEHIRTVQRVGEYAAMMRVSRVTLNRAVVEQFGVTAAHLLRQRLLEGVKNGLLFEGRSVSQLAAEYGFSDPSHLMRFFKQQTGKTCTAYLSDYRRGLGD